MRIAVGHVFHQPDHADHIGLGLATGQGLHQADHRAGTAHVPFHHVHTRPRFEGNSARIKGDPLADKGQGFGARARALPAHDHQLALPSAALTDTQQGAHAQFGHASLVQYLYLDAQLS